MRTEPTSLRFGLGRRHPALPHFIVLSLLALCCVGPWAVATPTHAAGHFEVRPVRIELSHPQDIGSVELGNRGPTPITIQADVRSWSQETGQSTYLASEGLLVSPPIFVVEPGKRQVVRVGLRQGIPVDVEQAFRIFFTEIPTARDDASSSATGVDISLRLAIPVFAAPQALLEPPLEGKLRSSDGDRFELSLSNPGNVHVQIRQLKCEGDPRHPPADGQPVLGYLLAGSQRRFLLTADDPTVTRIGQSCHLVADTDRGPRTVEIHRTGEEAGDR